MKDTSFVDRLAQIIRTADGNHDMGAGALADAIVDSGIIWEVEQSAQRIAALRIRDAVDEWEASGDDEKLVNETIDPWISSVLERA